MNYELTIFKSIYDNKTHRKLSLANFDAFEDLLFGLSRQPGYKPKKDEKFHPDASPLISPAVFKKDVLRRNANVEYWGCWAALDIDYFDTTLDEALSTFSEYNYIAYSSASSTLEKPKFRVILPLSRKVVADEIRHFWYSLNTKFNSLGDPQTKDLSRMYYVPAIYPDAYNFFISHKDKKDLDVSTILSDYEYAKDKVPSTLYSGLPTEMQAEIDEYRKSKLTNTNVIWSGINDCPYVNTRLINEYRSITETGWYTKMFQILLSTASLAMKNGYPITAFQLAALGRELDNMTGCWYKERPLELEAERAIAYACKNL